MKNLVALLVAGVVTSAVAATPEQDAAVKKQMDEIDVKTAVDKAEAKTMSTKAVYDEWERLRKVFNIKHGQDKFISFDDDSIKLTAFMSDLERRAASDDGVAAYYFGMANSSMCGNGASSKNDLYNSLMRDCWLKSLKFFRIASDDGMSASSFAVARMYENGFGVDQSKFVAAEWYAKASQQAMIQGDKDAALTYDEDALKLVPDHPAALRLKKELMQ